MPQEPARADAPRPEPLPEPQQARCRAIRKEAAKLLELAEKLARLFPDPRPGMSGASGFDQAMPPTVSSIVARLETALPIKIDGAKPSTAETPFDVELPLVNAGNKAIHPGIEAMEAHRQRLVLAAQGLRWMAADLRTALAKPKKEVSIEFGKRSLWTTVHHARRSFAETIETFEQFANVAAPASPQTRGRRRRYDYDDLERLHREYLKSGESSIAAWCLKTGKDLALTRAMLNAYRTAKNRQKVEEAASARPASSPL
jgi:hypothetical protein